MDPQIIGAVIVSIATVAAVVIGWWLQEEKSHKKTSLDSKAIEPDISVLHQHTEEKSKTAVDANSHPSGIAPGANISKITVKDIVDAINAAPPFQKDQIAKQYNGIKVRWTGYLKDAKEDSRDKESVRVNLNVKRDTIIGYSFWFTEKIVKIPEIRALKRESAICVVGEILSASGAGVCVDLKPITVEVLENHA